MRTTAQEVVGSLDRVPAFPALVKQILKTLDDDNAAMGGLVNHLQHDAVISGRTTCTNCLGGRKVAFA